MTPAIPIAEHPDHWEIHLDGRGVTQCRVDHAFAINLWWLEEDVTIRIEQPFTLESAGRTYEFDAETRPTNLGPALGVLHKGVDRVLAWKDGRLEVFFTNGDVLTAGPHARFEAWEIDGSMGFKFVALESGEGLAVWMPRTSPQ